MPPPPACQSKLPETSHSAMSTPCAKVSSIAAGADCATALMDVGEGVFVGGSSTGVEEVTVMNGSGVSLAATNGTGVLVDAGFVGEGVASTATLWLLKI